MSAAGRDSAVSRKRPAPLVPAHASPAARSGGAVGGSGSPKAKRRLFAAGPGSRSTVASAAADAEADRQRRRRQLILIAGAVASAAVSFIWVMRRRRKYSAQQFAQLNEAIVGLATAVRVATAPVEPHPDLYPTVMGVQGFTKEQLLAVLIYLNEGRPRGAAFLAMSEPHRTLWIEHILTKQEI